MADLCAGFIDGAPLAPDAALAIEREGRPELGARVLHSDGLEQQAAVLAGLARRDGLDALVPLTDGWWRWRQREGALNRVPKGFHARYDAETAAAWAAFYDRSPADVAGRFVAALRSLVESAERAAR